MHKPARIVTDAVIPANAAEGSVHRRKYLWGAEPAIQHQGWHAHSALNRDLPLFPHHRLTAPDQPEFRRIAAHGQWRGAPLLPGHGPEYRHVAWNLPFAVCKRLPTRIAYLD